MTCAGSRETVGGCRAPNSRDADVATSLATGLTGWPPSSQNFCAELFAIWRQEPTAKSCAGSANLAQGVTANLRPVAQPDVPNLAGNARKRPFLGENCAKSAGIGDAWQ